MLAVVSNDPKTNLLSGSNPHVFDSVNLTKVADFRGLTAFLSFEYSPSSGHNDSVNYWRASEIVGQAREKEPNKDKLLVVGTNNTIYYLENKPKFAKALIEAGELLKNGGIPAPIKLVRERREDDPDHNIALIADYYPESHAIVLRENTMELSSTVNPEDFQRLSKVFSDLRNETNKIVVAAEVRTPPGKQELDNDTLRGFLYMLDRNPISNNFLSHVNKMLTVFSLSPSQAQELFEMSSAFAISSGSYARESRRPLESADQSAAAFEIAVTALQAVPNPHDVSNLISNAFEVGGKLTGLLAQTKATEYAHAIVSSMGRIPELT